MDIETLSKRYFSTLLFKQSALFVVYEIISSLNDDSEIKSDLLYRRGGSYERLGDYENADKDLLNSLKINPEDAYVLNYLAY